MATSNVATMPDAIPTARRRPFQFRLWQLLWLTTWVALILGTHHLMGRAIERFGMGVVGILVFFLAETTVVISGTAIAVNRGSQRLPKRLLRGSTAGSCLAALCFGIPPVLMAIGMRDVRPLIALLMIMALGALFGLLIALVAPLVRPFFVAKNITPAEQSASRMFTDRRHPALKHATDHVMRALVEAKRFAIDHQHDLITPDHLLWAIGKPDRCVARFILERLGVDFGKLTDRLGAWLAAYPPDEGFGLPLLSAESERVLNSALREAESMADTVFYLGTEHLLLGLLAHPELHASRILQRQGVTLEGFRAEVSKLLTGK